MILTIEHVQLAMPAGGENSARAFYQKLLGIAEVLKPVHLAKRGGCWFEQGSVKIHLGVEDKFSPAKKAHPALLVDNLAALIKTLEDAGCVIKEDQPLEGYDRRYVDDPFGNRIEIMQRI